MKESSFNRTIIKVDKGKRKGAMGDGGNQGKNAAPFEAFSQHGGLARGYDGGAVG